MDQAVIDYFQRVVQPDGPLTAFFRGINIASAGGTVWIVMSIALMFFRPTRTAGIAMALGMILMVISTDAVLKFVFARPRPYEAADLTILVRRLTSPSFPSGHSAGSVAAAGALFWYHRKWGAAALVLAALVCVTRLYFSVHYLTDVLGGILLGAICAFAGVLLTEKVWKPRKDRWWAGIRQRWEKRKKT